MTATLASLVLGAVAAFALRHALLGTDGRRRRCRACVSGALLLTALTLWALWHNTFPATFGPFVVVTLAISDTRRNLPPGRP